MPELTPPDCTATKPATNWNSTLFDGIVRDFMEAVCGEQAITGTCGESSTALQLQCPMENPCGEPLWRTPVENPCGEPLPQL